MVTWFKKSGLWLWGLSLIILVSCEESAIPHNLDNLSLNLDTASFAVTEMISYQSSPEMGSSDYLYFGNEDGFQHPYSLIQIKEKDISNSLAFHELNDSLLTIDSAEFFLHFQWDSTVEKVAFQLRYFPDGGDSVFSELHTHFSNFDPSSASSIISFATMETDSSDTNYTTLRLRFSIAAGIFKSFIDTVKTDFNRSFLVESVETLTRRYRFISRDNNIDSGPELILHVRQMASDSSSIDTTTVIYHTQMDLSVTLPPQLGAQDSVLSVGQAMGLKALALVDLSTFSLPDKAVIKSADLILHKIDNDSLPNYLLISYPIIGEGDFSSFKSFTDDPYEMDLNYFVSTPVRNNVFKVNERSFVHDVARGKVSNSGIKLYSSINNDPFTTVYFHGVENDSLYPVMRIQYVVP